MVVRATSLIRRNHDFPTNMLEVIMLSVSMKNVCNSPKLDDYKRYMNHCQIQHYDERNEVISPKASY